MWATRAHMVNNTTMAWLVYSQAGGGGAISRTHDAPCSLLICTNTLAMYLAPQLATSWPKRAAHCGFWSRQERSLVHQFDPLRHSRHGWERSSAESKSASFSGTTMFFPERESATIFWKRCTVSSWRNEKRPPLYCSFETPAWTCSQIHMSSLFTFWWKAGEAMVLSNDDSVLNMQTLRGSPLRPIPSQLLPALTHEIINHGIGRGSIATKLRRVVQGWMDEQVRALPRYTSRNRFNNDAKGMVRICAVGDMVNTL